MSKSPDAFRTISEVADWLGIQAHVLRFWESKFTQVKPVKRAGGRRYYRPVDMLLLGGIKSLLHDDGLTIKGVQKILREQGVGHVSDLSPPLDEVTLALPGVAEASEPVLSFKSKSGKQPALGDAPDPEPVTELHRIDPEDAPQEPEPEPQPEDTAPATQESAPPAPERSLPSFLSRPAPLAPEPEAEAEPEPEIAAHVTFEEPAAPQTRNIDAPDPPDDADIPYAPGVLASTARLPALSAQQAREIAPLADALRAWLARDETRAGE